MINTFLFKSYRVSYLDVGKGEPMIFFHNGGTDHSIWRYQIEHFSKSHRVLAIDLLGCGESDRPDIPYTMKLYVDLLENFMRIMNFKSAILVGNCIGAATCLEFSLRNTTSVSSLVLFNVYGGSSMIKSIKLVDWGLVSPELAAKILTLPYFTSAKDLWGQSPDKGDPVYLHYTQKIETHPGLLQYRKNMVEGASSYEKFGSALSLPKNFPKSILFWGQMNRALSVKHGRRMRDWLQPTEYVELAGAGHLAMCESPNLVNDRMQAFLGPL
jgi:pimeloyl-ACP methyl ester carboxylesterase